jgi:hypothetical protein
MIKRETVTLIMRQILLAILFTLPCILTAQNIYDLPNSMQFGDHLMKTGQYSLASEEYERIVFMNPGDDSTKQQLIRSYFLNKRYHRVLRRSDSLFSSPVIFPRLVAIDYSRSLIFLDNQELLDGFLHINKSLTDTDRLFMIMNRQLLSSEWKKAKLTYADLGGTPFERSYEGIFASINNAKFKSPALAAGMSAILPGSGKFYTGEWKDGLVSLLFVSAFAVQAYRGYNDYGPNSGFFIAYAGIGSVFYLSNIYGSHKSAKKYNEKIKQRIQHKVADSFITAF